MAAFASKQEMEPVVERSLELMRTDPTFIAGTKKTHMSLGFEIEDLGITYILKIDGGKIETEMGADPDDADFELALSSDDYDKMFTGKLNPMKAALTGDLYFSGNVKSAMQLQGLLPEMIRIYKKTKLEIAKKEE